MVLNCILDLWGYAKERWGEGKWKQLEYGLMS